MIQVLFSSGRSEGSGELEELSLHGAHVATCEPLQPGALIHLCFCVGPEATQAVVPAKVVEATERGFTVQFKGLDPKVEATLRSVLPSLARRKYPRVPLEAVLGVQPTPSSAAGVDISAGGIRFQWRALGAEVGDTLTVELTLEGQTFEAVGTVVRARELQGSLQEVALRFTEISPVALALIEDLLG